MKTAIWSAMLLAATAVAAQNLPAPQTPSVDPQVSIPHKTAKPSKKDNKKARHEFEEGLKRKRAGDLQEALANFQAAADLDPENMEYATARAVTQEQTVMAAVERGNRAMEQNQTVEAQADYRMALRIDPGNQFALQQLKSALPPVSPRNTSIRYSDGDEQNFEGPILLAPENVKKPFSYRGDSRGLITTVMQAYGITPTIDNSVATKHVRFDIEPTDFEHASYAMAEVTDTFWVPLGLRQVLVLADNAANHREYEKMVLRTFYFPDATSPTELQDMVNVFRVIFDVRFIVPQPARNAITIRAPQPTVEAITEFFDGFDGARPQVSLDVQVFQVSGNLTRQLGIQPPQQFTTFALGPALSQLGGTNIQQIINNLIASGAINQANSTSLQALITQALGQQFGSLFQTPFATYGGGITLMALTLPGTSANLSVTKADLQSLDHLTVRAAQNSPATIRVGERYPILNSTFSPIYNTRAISSVLGNGSYIAPFPSFNYEDLGLTVKATPAVQKTQDVRLALEMQIRSLGAGSNNGIPIINNEEYKGTISLKDGEPGVVISYLTDSQSRTLSGVPGLGQLPGLNYVLGNSNVNNVQSELLVIITPHILRATSPTNDAIALPRGS